MSVAALLGDLARLLVEALGGVEVAALAPHRPQQKEEFHRLGLVANVAVKRETLAVERLGLCKIPGLLSDLPQEAEASCLPRHVAEALAYCLCLPIEPARQLGLTRAFVTLPCEPA